MLFLFSCQNIKGVIAKPKHITNGNSNISIVQFMKLAMSPKNRESDLNLLLSTNGRVLSFQKRHQKNKKTKSKREKNRHVLSNRVVFDKHINKPSSKIGNNLNIERLNIYPKTFLKEDSNTASMKFDVNNKSFLNRHVYKAEVNVEFSINNRNHNIEVVAWLTNFNSPHKSTGEFMIQSKPISVYDENKSINKVRRNNFRLLRHKFDVLDAGFSQQKNSLQINNKISSIYSKRSLRTKNWQLPVMKMYIYCRKISNHQTVNCRRRGVALKEVPWLSISTI